jgi:hypothetical protein
MSQMKLKKRQERIMNFRAVDDPTANPRGLAKNFELNDSKSSIEIELMTKAVVFRNAAGKIVNKNIEYNIVQKEMDIYRIGVVSNNKRKMKKL